MGHRQSPSPTGITPAMSLACVGERVANMATTEKLVYDQLLLNFLNFRSSTAANGFG
jgi:hypothetical protein